MRISDWSSDGCSSDLIEESGTPQVSSLTRRRIIALFDGEPLCHEYDELEFLEQIWPLAAMSTVWDNGREDRSLRDDIIQHTIRNDDWTKDRKSTRLNSSH